MIYKQLPNIKQYNRNGDKIDPFCGNFEMPVFSEVAYSGDYYDLSNIPDITSSDNSINITYPFSNDSDVNSFDLTLNTSMVELIDFTNFHNYYIREVTDWTSEHSANLKHHIVHCELADEDLTIVDMSQSHSATTGVDRVFYYERNTTAASIVYIPLIAILGTDFTCSLNVSIQFGNTGEKFNTKCILLGDNPPDFTWCFCKNIPFNLVGQIDDRTPNGQLYEFIEIPEWFIGRIEISIYKIKPRVLGTIFTLTNNSNTPTVTEFIGSGTYELYPFTSLSSYSDSGIVRTFSTIVATSHDKYGVLDADFFIDDLSVFEKQSNNTIPDWIINDLYVHEVALRNRMNETILRNTQLNFDNYYTKSEVNQMIPTIPTNISSFTNDANYVTASQLPTVPSNIVLNRSIKPDNDYSIAIGSQTTAGISSNDDEYPLAYVKTSFLHTFKVDGGQEEYYHDVIAGTTYYISRMGTTIQFTPSTNGRIIMISGASGLLLASNTEWRIEYNVDHSRLSYGFYPNGIEALSSATIFIVPSNIPTSFYNPVSLVYFWFKRQYSYENLSIGNYSSANSDRALSIGGGRAAAEFSCAIGHAYANALRSVAIGREANANGPYSIAIGDQALGWSTKSTAIGYYSAACGDNSIAIGEGSQAGYFSDDGSLPFCHALVIAAISFTENNTTKFLYKGTYGEDVTITVNGTTFTTTPPDTHKLCLIIIYHSDAKKLYGNIDRYATINGKPQYLNSNNNTHLTPIEITGSPYHAVWIEINNSNVDYNNINSFSFICLFKSSTIKSVYNISIGNMAICTESQGITIGYGVQNYNTRQIVLGSYNLPDTASKLIIGDGDSPNTRSNILTIDDKKVMHVKGITNEIRTIDTEGNATNIINIQQGIIKVIGGGSITLSTSNTVEGLSVKIYASGSNVTVTNFSLTITAGKWHEFIFLDNNWRAQE